MTNPTQPLISIDVVPFSYDEETEKLTVALGPRLFEPFKGELALPGVLLNHERVDEAALRALESKTGIEEQDVLALADVGVFDNPDRDPRGPTLSVTKLAAVRHVGAAAVHTPVTEVRGLPFDHDTIVHRAAAALAAAMWNDKDVTHGILPDQFSTRAAANVQRQLVEAANLGDPNKIYSANVKRTLNASPWVEKSDEKASSTRAGGRPSSMWQWV